MSTNSFEKYCEKQLLAKDKFYSILNDEQFDDGYAQENVLHY